MTATATPTDEHRIRACFGETIEREWLVPDSIIRMAIVQVMDGKWSHDQSLDDNMEPTGATYTPLRRWVIRIRLADQRLVTMAQKFEDIDAASSIASQMRQAAHDSDGVDFIEDDRPGRHVYSGC